MKEKYQISFSGGRTSAYMTKLLLDNFSDKYDFIVTFANTGLEHEKTLEFINNCDKYFGFNTVWLEADVKYGERKGTSFKIVNYETASRNGEPFEEVIKKYGIPNPSYLHCTRELKLNVMQSYLKSVGIHHTKIKTAIGIREDEKRRVSKTKDTMNIEYPLIDLFPSDKQDVLDFWKEQSFDLGLDEWDGNCRGCFKKSFKKIFKQLDGDPTILDFHIKMESLYPQVGNKNGYWEDVYNMSSLEYEYLLSIGEDVLRYVIGQEFKEYPNRVFFRGNTSASVLKQMWVDDDTNTPERHLSGGCSESCEVYATEG